MALSLCLSVILAIVTIDQATKVLLMDVRSVIIPKLLIFEPRLNDGAAFSTLRGERVFFVVFTVIALFFMLYVLIARKWSNHKLFRVTLSVMIGGVIGNFIDRMAIGAVRDFIYIPPFNFVCNIADIAITAACVMFVIYVFFIRDKEEQQLKAMAEGTKNTKGESSGEGSNNS